MFNRADHVKKHFLRIHKGVDYDAKLTRRIKGIDYDNDDGYEFEPLDKTLIHLKEHVSPEKDINSNSISSKSGKKTNGDAVQVGLALPSSVTSSSMVSSSLTGPTILSPELMSRILEGNLLSKQNVQSLAALLTNPVTSSALTSHSPSSTTPSTTGFGSSASNLAALFPLDLLKSQPLFVSGNDLKKWPKMQEVVPTKTPPKESKKLNGQTRDKTKIQGRSCTSNNDPIVVEEDYDQDRYDQASTDGSESSHVSTSSSSIDHPVVSHQPFPRKKNNVALKVFPRSVTANKLGHKRFTNTTNGNGNGNGKPKTMFTQLNKKTSLFQDMAMEEDGVFDCESCGCSFVDFPSLHTHRYLLHQHVSQVEQALPYECCLCHKRFSVQRAVIEHMTKHSSLNERKRQLKKEARERERQRRISRNSIEVLPHPSSSIEGGGEEGNRVGGGGGGGNRRKQFVPRKIVKSDEEEMEDQDNHVNVVK